VIEWIKASKHIAMLPQVSSEQNKRASSDLGRSTPSNVAEFIRELTSTDGMCARASPPRTRDTKY